MPNPAPLAQRLKYATAVVIPALIFGGMKFFQTINEIGALYYFQYGTAEKRERQRQIQEENERASRERRLKRRQEAMEKENKSKSE